MNMLFRGHNGKGFSLFGDLQTVVPPACGEGEGLIKVEVVDQRDELVLVRLPAQTFENGQHVKVNANTLQSTPPFHKVGA